MLAGIVGGFVSLSALSFDMTTLLAVMDPGRERVQVSASDGETYLYACKPGPDGETPRDQAEKAHAVYEQYLFAFAEKASADLLIGNEAGEKPFVSGLSLLLKADSWLGAIGHHLELEYGCTPFG